MNIKPLGRDNYLQWAEDIRFLLLEKGCAQFIDGTAEQPTAEASYRDRQDFRKYEQKALGIIYTNISEDYRHLISDAKDALTAWETLKLHFKPESRARIISLLDKFFMTHINDGEEVGLYAARLKKVVAELKEAGRPLEDLYQAFQLIRYLPQEFQGIIQSIYRWSDEDFTFDKVSKELVVEESRLQQARGDFEKTFAESCHVNKSKNTRVVKNQPKPKTVRCSYCNRFGHISTVCNFKKNDFNKSKFKGASLATEALINEDSNVKKDAWVFDTAASSHFTNDKKWFCNFQKTSNTKMFLAAGDRSSPVLGKGTVKLCFKVENTLKEVTLYNVLYAPSLRRNLISGPACDKQGATFVGKRGTVEVTRNNQLQFKAIMKNGLYYCYPVMNTNPSQSQTSKVTKGKNVYNFSTTHLKDIKLWHQRFNHTNVQYITNTSRNNGVKGLPQFKSTKLNCEPCRLNKQVRVSFKPIGKIRSKGPLDLIHMDICGPLPSTSIDGKRYFLSIIDDYSRKCTVYPLRNKDDTYMAFRRFQTRAERYLNRKIKAIRTDNGLEFVNQTFQSYLNSQGIRAERTNTYTPEQNGVCERFNRTAVNAIKTMLKDANLPNSFWSEALMCFVYTFNRLCHGNNQKTPFELYGGNKPSVSHLKRFGATAYIGIPKQLRKKLDPRAKKGIMVGYAQLTKGYRIWVPEDHKVVETINVSFEEQSSTGEAVMGPRGDFETTPEDQGVQRTNNISSSDDSDSDYDSSPAIRPAVSTPSGPQITKDPTSSSLRKLSRAGIRDQSLKDLESPPVRLTPFESIKWLRKAVPRKTGKKVDIYYGIESTNTRLRSNGDVQRFCTTRKIEYKPEFFDFSSKSKYSGPIPRQSTSSEKDDGNISGSDYESTEEAHLIEIIVPNTYKESQKSPQKKDWDKAMKEEIKTIEERNVWQLVPKPEKETILGNRWVFTAKTNQKNEVVRYKARLVAQGYRQVKGQSYDETFSPVVNFTIIRLFFALLVCLLSWKHYQLDIHCAYLYAPLQERIYMKQPLGFIDQNFPEHVCLLKKALYGLHQSGRAWHQELNKTLENQNFKSSKFCNCTYTFKKDVVLLLYVDDIIIFGRTHDNISEVIKILKSIFDIKELGSTKKLLGVNFEHKKDQLLIHQREYIEKLEEKFGKYTPPITSLPISKNTILTKQDCPEDEFEKERMAKLPFRAIIGSLSYLAGRTRPDISYAVNILSQYQSNPGQAHWDSLIKLLGYVLSTKNLKLNLSNLSNINLICFTDADYAADRDDRVSISGNFLLLDQTPISWRCSKQKSVSLSSMEAEYIAMSEASKELLWLINLLNECSERDIIPKSQSQAVMQCDNMAAIDFSKSPVENNRTKHIDIRYHFVRNLVLNDVFKVTYISSNQNQADFFTKPPSKLALKLYIEKYFCT